MNALEKQKATIKSGFLIKLIPEDNLQIDA